MFVQLYDDRRGFQVEIKKKSQDGSLSLANSNISTGYRRVEWGRTLRHKKRKKIYPDEQISEASVIFSKWKVQKIEEKYKKRSGTGNTIKFEAFQSNAFIVWKCVWINYLINM